MRRDGEGLLSERLGGCVGYLQGDVHRLRGYVRHGYKARNVLFPPPPEAFDGIGLGCGSLRRRRVL
jgi:hypothetical protein